MLRCLTACTRILRALNPRVPMSRQHANNLINPPTPMPIPRTWAHWRRVMLATAFGLFAAAATIGMVQPRDALAPPLPQQVDTVLPIAAQALQVNTDGVDALPYVVETRIESGDTVADVLARLDVSAPGLLAFLTVDASARSIYRLYPGRSVQAGLNADGKFLWLRYLHTPNSVEAGEVVTRLLHVEANGEGFRAEERRHGTERQVRAAVGTIRSSLFGATDALGIPDAITLQMAEILGSKMDFLRDLREGDTFRVLYETRQYEGRYVGAGRVLALEFDNRGKRQSAVWFEHQDGSGYYDFDGKSLQGAFLRNAIKFTRISSTFGKRKHPIHQRWIEHKGVDYAAPTGTPIHATADGTVSFAGKQTGYGNVVILEHHSRYSTLYAHQSRIAPGIKKGIRVSQGQVIGYVGMTGWATGPHLHYEFRIAGKHVDPLSVELPVARLLTPAQATAFAAAVEPVKAQMQLLAALQEAESAQAVAAR